MFKRLRGHSQLYTQLIRYSTCGNCVFHIMSAQELQMKGDRIYFERYLEAILIKIRSCVSCMNGFIDDKIIFDILGKLPGKRMRLINDEFPAVCFENPKHFDQL